jgi:hypothetical protein
MTSLPCTESAVNGVDGAVHTQHPAERQHFLRKGLDADAAHVASLDYSARSLRAGFLSSAANAGTAEWKLRDRGRHATPEVAANYIRLHADWTTTYGVEL